MVDGLVIAVGVVAVLAAAGVFAIAFRRPKSEDDWQASVPEATRRADRGRADVSVAAAAGEGSGESSVAVLEADEEAPSAEVAVVEDQETAPAEPELTVTEVVQYREVSEEQQGVNRRMFLNRALGTVFFVWLGGMAISYLSFMWPRVRGGFGADIDAGDATELLGSVLSSDGTVTPLFVPEARSWIVPLPADAAAGTQFEESGTIAGGLVALFQTCVHLGCRVPWCASSQGFECPCHGSKYTFAGEYFSGPAPRNLDRFVVAVNDQNRFIISTGSIITTPRAQEKAVAYPQGPSCI